MPLKLGIVTTKNYLPVYLCIHTSLLLSCSLAVLPSSVPIRRLSANDRVSWSMRTMLPPARISS